MQTAIHDPVTGLDQLLTSGQVRVLIGVSPRQLRRLLDSEVIPPADAFVGPARRWRRSTIQRFMSECIAKANSR